MLLTTFSGHIRHLTIAVWSVFLLGNVNCAAALPPCFVDFPVYGPEGEKLSFRVTSVTLEEDEKLIDFLSTTSPEYRMTVAGERLYFPKQAMTSDVLVVTFEGSEGKKIRERVALVSCQQRTSVRYGTRDTGADVAGTDITGRLTGCPLDGDWWVRAMPMFGGWASPQLYEGLVRPADGVFSFLVIYGERLIVVFGKDKHTVKTVTVDVIEGDDKNMGVVDLSGSCPP